MLFKALAFLSMVCVCYTQVPHLGKCPDVQVVADLDVAKYLGPWYEIKKFFFLIEAGETCIVANYSLKPDGHIEVFNTGVNSNGTLVKAVGDAYPPNAAVKSKLAVTFNGSPRVPYWVVDTDYDNYSLVWSCTDLLGFVQADFAWILSRTRTLDSATIAKLERDLAAFGVDTTSFTTTVQTGCAAN